MIRVTIEEFPYGTPIGKKMLFTMDITNDGDDSDDKIIGHYTVDLFDDQGNVCGEAIVGHHRRDQRNAVLRLAERALASLEGSMPRT